MTGRPRILVVSDRFPPDTDGGAELSLHETLQAVSDLDFDIRILALTPGSAPVDITHVNGRPIRWVTYEPFWPQNMSRAKARHAGPPGLLRAMIGELAQRPASAGRLARYALYRIGDQRMPHPGSDSDTIAAAGLARAILQGLVADWQPDIIHADNKLSILLAASVDRQKSRLVAMVRDHRFFCGHAEQSMMVGERACAACSFGCADHISAPTRQVLRIAMAQEVKHRQTALAKADHVVTTSRYLAQELQSLGLRDEIPAVGNPHPEPDPGDLRPADVPDGPPTVLFVGNLRREKGPLVLADTFPELMRIPGLRVVFAGRGPAEREILRRAQSAGMGDRIELAGFLGRAELFRVFQQATVVVAPTLWPEPFGRLPLEAGIARRPIVASALAGHMETIVDGETGILFPPGDRARLAAAIAELAQDRQKAIRIGNQAERHIRATFNPDVVAGRLAAVWRDALNVTAHKSGLSETTTETVS